MATDLIASTRSETHPPKKSDHRKPQWKPVGIESRRLPSDEAVERAQSRIVQQEQMERTNRSRNGGRWCPTCKGLTSEDDGHSHQVGPAPAKVEMECKKAQALRKAREAEKLAQVLCGLGAVRWANLCHLVLVPLSVALKPLSMVATLPAAIVFAFCHLLCKFKQMHWPTLAEFEAS